MTLGVVGGSDLVKITEQLGKSGLEPAYTIKLVAPLCSSLQITLLMSLRSIPLVAVFTDYDYVFSENGLVAHKNGELIGTQVSLRAPYLYCTYMYRSTLNFRPSNLVSTRK